MAFLVLASGFERRRLSRLSGYSSAPEKVEVGNWLNQSQTGKCIFVEI